MNRANSADLRKALEAANTYAKLGILFVPMPVLDDADASALWIQVSERFEKMAQDAEKVEP